MVRTTHHGSRPFNEEDGAFSNRSPSKHSPEFSCPMDINRPSSNSPSSESFIEPSPSPNSWSIFSTMSCSNLM